ncbi:glycosyltransferase family 2 protein [Tautonia marina]|uniref:glycosyltransferase family 2 protein n=1 Tax=Tautonia marina TaxID=2653855 RepID=UPI001375BB9D|nr:glycosyltransferase family 2 protein [Tautonia marina]
MAKRADLRVSGADTTLGVTRAGYAAPAMAYGDVMRAVVYGDAMVDGTSSQAAQRVGAEQEVQEVSGAFWYARPTLPNRVGVVIPTRNRPHWLPHMLGSLMMQTHRPERVLVVDDGDDDSAEEVVGRYPGVEYLRARVGSGLSGNPARNVGMRELADLPYLCFLDDDDMIPPDYLEVLLATIATDCRAAAAYPRLWFCGSRQGTLSVPYHPDLLGRSNLSGVPALIRTDALSQVGGWPVFAPDPNGTVPHDDWALWRRFRDHGWRMIPAPVDYYYYRHDDGVCRSKARANHQSEWRRTIDPTDLVTLAIPWSGREHLIDAVLDAVARQSYPASQLHLLFYDNSGSEAVGKRLRRWLLEQDGYAGHSYHRDPRPAVAGLSASELADAPLDEGEQGRRRHGRAVNHRVGAIWNRIGQLAQTDLIWCLEDDVIPPADALDRLLDRMGPTVDGVTANYRSRVVPGCSVAWRYTNLETGELVHLEGGAGLEPIGGTGLGCALVRRGVFREGPARSGGEAVGYDCNLWLDVARRGGTVLIDWELRCEHRIGRWEGREGVAALEGSREMV